MWSLRKWVLVFSIIGLNFATSDAQRPRFGFKGGVVFNTSDNGSSKSETWPIIGGLIELSLPLPMIPFALRTEVEFSWHTEEKIWDLGEEIVHITISGRDIKVNFGYKNTWYILSPIEFYTGAAPEIHICSAEVKVNGETNSELDTWIGFHLFGGMECSIRGPTFFGEVGWGVIFPDEGSWSQFVFAGGVKF